ncbi:HDOD domain-containing protein [Halioxenophilus sp. WMMB6]|uniref:HDOD domain-containing protein n=1 Tax=Halioxenophilus sp. WMMB6 TaxID=3073815 RepID=UPI00295E9934|nr:HDOD domain-containing protein [Halioxenophilus sp. WMMB6]
MFHKLFQKEKSKPKKASIQMEAIDLSVFSLDKLKGLIPFASSPESTNIITMSFTELVELRTSERLFEAGLNDEWDYYLLEGEVGLIAFDGRESVIEASSPKAKSPLAYLRPRKYSAVVRSKNALFVKIPHHVLDLGFQQAKSNHQWGAQEAVIIGQVHQETLFDRVEQEIHKGTLVVPTLPEVAVKVREACQDNDSSAATITKIVAHDTSISAKLLAASNSPLYRGAVPINTLQDAIARLGRQTTQHLVYYYATKELFETPIPLLRKLFQANWQRSLERAVMAHTLAKFSDSELNPDTAFLCGLLFRIGDLVVFQYVADIEEEPNELAKVQNIAEATSSQISRLLVEDWKLPEAVSEALQFGGQWRYTSGQKEPDYGELMIVTNIHLRMLHNNMNGLPDLNQVPAIKRILTEDFAPDTSIIIEAKKALAEFMRL